MGVDSVTIKLVGSILIYYIAGSLILKIILLNEIIRLIVALALYLEYGGKVSLAEDGNDGIWATERDGRTRMVVNCVKFSGLLTKESLLNLYKIKIQNDRNEFGSMLNDKMENIFITRMGYACWEKDLNFDISNHVRVLFSNEVIDKRKLENLIQELSKDMLSSKPQWEWIIVPRYKEGEGETETGLFIYRFLHAYSDALSAMICLKRYGFTSIEYLVDPLTFSIPMRKKIQFYLNATFLGPYTLLLISIKKFKEIWPKQNLQSPIKINFRWAESISMDTIRLVIRKAKGNTTMLAVIENAFISAAIKVLPVNRLPNEWIIGELAALMPYPDGKLKNQFTMFHYPINSLDKEWVRLTKSKKAELEAMMGPQLHSVYYAMKVVGRLPAILHSLFLRGASATLILSNVPLSRTKAVGLNGIEAEGFFGFPSQATDTGIWLCCTTYINSVKITASAKANWLSENELEDIVSKVPIIIKEWANSAK